MNVVEVVVKDTNKSLGFMCGECGLIHTHRIYVSGEASGGAIQSATACCDSKCEDCGATPSKGWIVCNACRAKREAKKEADAFEKAEKIALADYDGAYLYIEGAPHDGYVDPDELEDVVRDMVADGRSPPTYAWSTSPKHATFDLDDSLRNDIHDNHHEDAYDWVDQHLVAAAQLLIDAAIKDVVSYMDNRKIVVLLPEYKEDPMVDDGAPTESPEPAEVTTSGNATS
jgi:hypothetical protein